MNGGSASIGVAMEKLVGNNYNYWKLCMEAYLQGQNLWDLIEGDDTEISALYIMLNYTENGRSNVEKPYLPCELLLARNILIMFVI